VGWLVHSLRAISRTNLIKLPWVNEVAKAEQCQCSAGYHLRYVRIQYNQIIEFIVLI
jgi:hypothetical protein